MENHHAINGKTHYKWPFSIVFCMFTRPGTPAVLSASATALRCFAAGSGTGTPSPLPQSSAQAALRPRGPAPGASWGVYGYLGLPSGNLTVCYWKWPFIVDFPINSMVIFHSYVKLPEGNPKGWRFHPWILVARILLLDLGLLWGRGYLNSFVFFHVFSPSPSPRVQSQTEGEPTASQQCVSQRALWQAASCHCTRLSVK